MKQNTSNTFSLSYDASDSELKHHKISAKDLGTAISEMSILVSEAAKVLGMKNKEAIDDMLQVQAPAKQGSVIVDFILSIQNKDAIEILGILGFSAGSIVLGGSLLEILSLLKGREVTKVKRGKNSSTLITDDGDNIEVDKRLEKLITNKRARNAVHKIIAQPLEGKPNPKFKLIKSDKQETVVSNENDIFSFQPLSNEQKEFTKVEETRELIKFIRINFKSPKDWKVLHDQKEKTVTIDDENFMSRNEVFVKEQTYSVDMIVEKKSRPLTKDTIKYTISNIQKHQDK